MDDRATNIRYSTGEDARVGDHVDHDGWDSVVDDVIDTPQKLALWGIDEPGLMLACKEAGLVFVPCSLSSFRHIVLQSRA